MFALSFAVDELGPAESSRDDIPPVRCSDSSRVVAVLLAFISFSLVARLLFATVYFERDAVCGCDDDAACEGRT